MRALVASPGGRLAELALHGVESGGKRLRPALAIASATAVGGPEAVGERVIDAAAAVELLHLASLYHDDVLDAAATRRGRASANARWGDHAAVLGGDVLLAHAYRVAAGLGPAALHRLAHTLLALCAGQLAECDARFDVTREPAAYEASIRGKTAALLSAACWLGASAAGASTSAADALARFGAELGVAFQIVDDLLDLRGQGDALGKPAGSDLREGVFTLPVLLGLAHDPALAQLLVAGLEPDGVAEVAERVRAAGADARAAGVAVDRLRAAFDALDAAAPRPEGVRVLHAIGRLVLEPLERLGLADDPRPRAAAPDAAQVGAA